MLLRDQDRSRWDRAAIAAGEAHLERAAALHSPGRYQLQAAIAACHATSPSWEETDWLQIVTLYDLLLAHDPSPVPRLNRAVALAQLGPDQASRGAASTWTPLATSSTATTSSTPPGPSCSTGLGRDDEAAAANARALELTTNDAERRLLSHPPAPAPAHRRVVERA